jgi:hypothetical protein
MGPKHVTLGRSRLNGTQLHSDTPDHYGPTDSTTFVYTDYLPFLKTSCIRLSVILQ